MVYIILQNLQDFQSFHVDNEEFLDSLDPHIGEEAAMLFCLKNIAMNEFWTPLDVTFVQSEGGSDRLPDIGFWGHGGSLVLSQKALNVLDKFLIGYGELLPLNYHGERYYIFNCLTDVEPDLDNSEAVYQDGHFCDVTKLRFKPDVEAPIFKTSFENCRNLFCNQEFKAVVEKEKLGGIYFKEDLTAFI